MAEAVGARDGGQADAAHFLAMMFTGMGDECRVSEAAKFSMIEHSGLRIVRGLEGGAREDLLSCWVELWRGAVHSHRAFIDVEAVKDAETGGLKWMLAGPKRGQAI